MLWDGQLPVDAFDEEGRAVCKKLPVSRFKVDFAVRVPTAGLVPSCRHVHDTAPVLPAASRRSRRSAARAARGRAEEAGEEGDENTANLPQKTPGKAVSK